MLNENLKNTVVNKAVPCNLIAEIFKERDIAMEDEYAREIYDMYQHYFNNYDKDDYSLGSCVIFLKNYAPLKQHIDVNIYSGECYLATNGKYQGMCKLPNGADIIVFDVYSEEASTHMCQVLYYDGTRLKLFTPFCGNEVNVITMTCLGNECYSKIPEFKGDLYDKIYPDGLDEKDEDYEEKLCEKYVKFWGLNYNYDDITSNGFIDLDWEAIDKEIEEVLS